jgi:hypothetical protein
MENLVLDEQVIDKDELFSILTEIDTLKKDIEFSRI